MEPIVYDTVMNATVVVIGRALIMSAMFQTSMHEARVV